MDVYKKPSFDELVESMDLRSDLKILLNNTSDNVFIIDFKSIEKAVISKKLLQSPERVIFTLKETFRYCGKTLIFVSKEGFYSTGRYD